MWVDVPVIAAFPVLGLDREHEPLRVSRALAPQALHEVAHGYVADRPLVLHLVKVAPMVALQSLLEVIDFLKALLRHIDGPLLIVWDRLPAHRSRLVREFIELSEDHIATEYLPPYAPELNPVEYIWAYWKQHELPNVCPKDYWELDERARKALRRMRRKPRLITAFWKQSSLCLD